MSAVLGLVKKFGKFGKQKDLKINLPKIKKIETNNIKNKAKNIYTKTKDIIKGEGRAIKKEYLGIKKGIRNLGKNRTISKTAAKGLITATKYPYTTGLAGGAGISFLFGKDE